MNRPVNGEAEARGRRVAELHDRVAGSLFADLEASGLLPAGRDDAERAQARREWECFALYACVRGLVAEQGFQAETAAAIDAFHERAIAAWDRTDDVPEPERRRLVSVRYDEYGAIGQAGGASGAATVARRLGEAAAAHMTSGPRDELATWLGAIHEAIAEGVVEMLRRADHTATPEE